MIDLEYEMTFAGRIDGPLGPTIGSPARLCWQIAEATLAGPRITASLAMPGTDWIRLDSNGIRRQDQRTQFLTGDGALILMRYTRRRAALATAFAGSQAGHLLGDQAGLHVVLQTRLDADETAAAARWHGVAVGTLTRFYSGPVTSSGLVIGYGGASLAQVTRGSRILHQTLTGAADHIPSTARR
jgi:Protein of unknown function (DUF3237)